LWRGHPRGGRHGGTHGSYAEYTAVAPCVKIEPMARIPDGVTDEQAAALPIAATTALGSLELLGVSAGQWLVVVGATGGVGGYAVEMARGRGAHVVAAVRGDVDEARRLGAEEVYDSNAVDVIEAIRGAHPDGVDAVLDVVNGSDTISHDAEILKSGGSLVTAQFAADEGWFAERHITAHNIALTRNTSASVEGLNEIARLLAQGTITARIGSTFELDGAAQLLEKLHSGSIQGKAVIRI
jgi:NADPH2:quinone reductase